LEQVFTTTEGPVVITTRGKLVFISESFPLDLARQLTTMILDAQGTGEMKMARATLPTRLPHQLGAPGLASETWDPLTGSLVRFFSNAGVIKAVVDAEFRTAAQTH
jgi:hypothetical protein